MNIKDMMQKLIQDYIEDFDINKNLDNTFKQIGMASLDQMELAYIVGEKLDLKNRIPDELNIGQIVEHLETVIKDNKNENI